MAARGEQLNKSRNPDPSVHCLGIVIPTYNRVDALITCLGHLERQTMSDFEVIVVDDGSTDATARTVAQFQLQTSLRLRYVHQPNSGPARARNLGISLLRAPICLMIGDDIFASPDLVATHLLLHQRRPELHVAGLGLTLWSETGQKVSKFMRWLDTGGLQFAYGDLLNGIHPDWKHFYTSNLSAKTELLKRYPFNTTFPHAAAEDMELGYRLQSQHGLELVFMPSAVAYHLHPTSFRAACRRMLKVGPSSRLLHELWPELRTANPRKSRELFYRILLKNFWLIPPLIFVSDLLTQMWCPNPLMQITLRALYFRGYAALPVLGRNPDFKHQSSSPLS
jgi:glycosyltransferase involved in cell wall biosynthesis